jgi:hypothetical protein
MDTEVKPNPPRAKREAQVRLEKLDADTVRKLAKTTGVAVPYLLREAVTLLQTKYAKTP